MSSEGTVAPAPPGYTINLVNPESVGYHLVISAIVTAVLSSFFLGLRLYTRKFIVRGLGLDDCWIICAWVFAVSLSIGDCFETKYGMGYHIWDVKIDKFNTYLQLQLFVGAAYICALAFAKISVCCFYLRLSPEKSFRVQVFVVMGFTAAYSVAGFLVLLFSCNPVAASWNLALSTLPTTHCVNRPAEYLAQSAINIVTDICIVLLPLNTIWNLQLPFRQKITVTSIFALGLVVCVISIMRLKSIVVVLNSLDATWTTSNLLVWSTVEVHATIICGCIATLKPFVMRFFPNIIGKSSVSEPVFLASSKNNTDFGSDRLDGGAFALQSCPGHAKDYQHTTTVASKGMRGPRRRDGDAESQESIIGEFEHDTDLKEGVFVTRTVQIS